MAYSGFSSILVTCFLFSTFPAITIGVKILGPAAGFILGSFCTRLYVDLSDPGFGPSDPKWVGAWYLGEQTFFPFLPFLLYSKILETFLFFFCITILFKMNNGFGFESIKDDCINCNHFWNPKKPLIITIKGNFIFGISSNINHIIWQHAIYILYSAKSY